MYSFKQFLREVSGESDITIDEMIRECQPFIQQSGGRMIYRGIGKPENPITVNTPAGEYDAYHMTVRKDRRPLHTDAQIHNKVDDFMKREFGIAGRSGTLFVSGHKNMANMYGPSYIILPRGEFKFLWSPVIADLFSVDLTPEDDIDKKLREMHYQTTDLQDAIQSRHEIMIECKDYYALPITMDRQLENAIHK